MKTIIQNLEEQLKELKKQNATFREYIPKYDSVTDNRAFLIESMFIQIECNLQAAIRQAEVLERELF